MVARLVRRPSGQRRAGSSWFVLLLLASIEGPHIGDFEVARVVAELVEMLAVIVIAIGVVVALLAAARQWIRTSADDAFGVFKRYISRVFW